MEPAPYTTAVLFFRISSISIIPFALVGRRPHLRLSSRTCLADLYPSCQKQYTIGVNHFIPKCTFRSLLTPFELAPPARAVMGDNGLKEVQKGALVDGFILTDLNRPCCQVPLPLVNNALGIGHVRVGGVYQLSHLAAHLLLPARERMNVFVDAGVGLVCTHGSMIPLVCPFRGLPA